MKTTRFAIGTLACVCALWACTTTQDLVTDSEPVADPASFVGIEDGLPPSDWENAESGIAFESAIVDKEKEGTEDKSTNAFAALDKKSKLHQRGKKSP